jgi:DNA polymerase-3 subunit alpha
MVDDFITRKHSRSGAQIDYLHPDLKPVLGPTYGVILYQEQVMQIAQVLASYTLGGADLLRRAMGKKKPEEMAKQRSGFVQGARARGVEEGRATHIFDLMEKFAGYGFNKSHSAAYALLSYQTAYLKAHDPAAFMAAVLSADMDHTDKIVTLIDECAAMGLTVEPPDINASCYAFAVADERTIRYGLGAVKGVGRAAVDAIVEERAARGAFVSLSELCQRLDLSRVNRRALEALIRSGSLDCLGANRATLMGGLAGALQAGEQAARQQQAGQVDLFGAQASAAARAATGPASQLIVMAEWSASQRLAGERETLGLFLTGHPIAPYEGDLRHFASGRIVEFLGDRPMPPAEGRSPYAETRAATLAGLVLEVRRRGTRVSFTLDDRSGRIEVTMFEEVYQRHRDLIAKDALVQVEGGLRFDEFSDAWRLSAKRITSLPAVRERLARSLLLSWPPGADARLLERLEAVLGARRGGACAVMLRYRGQSASGMLSCGEEWKVTPSEELLEQLEGLLGPGSIELRYAVSAPAAALAQ